MARPRFDPQEWLDAGERVLERVGLIGFTQEALCQEMGRTSGSFRVYFPTWAGYLDQLVARWLDQRYRDQFLPIAAIDNPRQAFHTLITTGFGLSTAGRHLRTLAIQRPRFAEQLYAGDQATVDYIAELLGRCGLDAAAATMRAWALYATFHGAAVLHIPNADELLDLAEAWFLTDVKAEK